MVNVENLSLFLAKIATLEN